MEDIEGVTDLTDSHGLRLRLKVALDRSAESQAG